MKLIFTFLIAILSYSAAYTQCTPSLNKVIVLGDSWAFFSWTYNSFNQNFDKYGFTDVRAVSDTGLSILGAHADSYFYPPNRFTNVVNKINANPEVEIINMSLGGNDFLTMWHKSFTTAQSDSIIQDIIYFVKRDVDTIHSINSNLVIYIPGYDFPNFVETAGVVGSAHPFYGMWNNMGKPTAIEMNTFIVKFQQIFSDSIATWKNVFMVNNVGLMQWHYGQNSPLIIPPFSTYPPMSVPLPGGNPNFPSPRAAMGAGGTDSFHLKNGGFDVFYERATDLFYWKQLRKAEASIYADNTKSGTVYNDASISTAQVKLGNTAGLNAKGVLSFNTASLDETKTIAKASVFLKRKNLAGTNTITESLNMGIKSGSYGANDLLEGDDYLAISDAEVIVCTYGTIAVNNDWMRIDVPTSLLSYFNLLGITQLKLDYSFTNASRNIDFYNEIDTNFAAVLDIVYVAPVGVKKEKITQNRMSIFPNPTKNKLSITFGEFKTGIIEIYSILGEKIMFKQVKKQQKIIVDVTRFPKGIYWTRFSNKNQAITKSIIVVD